MNSHRHTLQRAIVLQEVQQIQGHATADMIYNKIRISHPTISRATVYRNLKALAQDRAITRIEVPDGADFYEAKNQKHYHIKCTCCGGLFDASLPCIPQLLELAQAKDQRFELFSYSLLFEGLCPSCKDAQPKIRNN